MAFIGKNDSEKQSSADTLQTTYTDSAPATNMMKEDSFLGDRKITTNATIGAAEENFW